MCEVADSERINAGEAEFGGGPPVLDVLVTSGV